MQKLYSIRNNHEKRYFERFGQSMHDRFIEGDLGQKLGFAAYLPYSLLRRLMSLGRTSQPVRRAKPIARPPSGAFRVAISIMGSLGDFMHHLPLIEAFYNTFAPMEVDFYVHYMKLDDRSKLAVSGLPFIRQVLDVGHLSGFVRDGSYDLHVEIRHVVKYHVLNRTKIVQDKPGLLTLIETADKRFEPYRFIFDSHPRLDGLFGKLMAERGMNALDASGYFGNLPVTRDTPIPFAPPASARVSASSHGLFGKRYITVHDGFEVDHAIAATSIRATRSWPLEHWQKFVNEFKARCPDVLVVQIGTSRTAGVIANVDVSLVDKATLPEACWIIEGALLHVDTEAGLIRVASATRTPSISIQGPSATEFFHFAHSIPVQSSFCRGCYWVNDDWMTRCLRGFQRPECMHQITPGQVANLAVRSVTASLASMTGAASAAAVPNREAVAAA